MNNIWIFGGANIDVCGTAVNDLIEYDSNIGTIELSFGGVGRNIAQSASLLLGNEDKHVKFVTCFSNDHYGALLRRDCEDLGMDCSYSIVSDKFPTSMYLAILEKNHDMKVGMSDMRILEEFNKDILRNVMQNVVPGDIVVVDSNMNVQLLRYVEKCIQEINQKIKPGEQRVLIASDPVSVNKIDRLVPFLQDISIFKPNKIEAEVLTGVKIEDDETARINLEWYLDRGVEEIIITMASEGVLLGTKEKLSWFRHRDLSLDSANGGGDAFMGAYLSQRLIGAKPHDAIMFAISAAITTIETAVRDRRKINKETIMKNIDTSCITETVI